MTCCECKNISVRLDFVYDYDFDKNGLFRYLIKKCPVGRNPAYPGPSQTLKMFASSVSFGYPETLIKPDEQVDFKTMNQAYSYVGFELMEGLWV